MREGLIPTILGTAVTGGAVALRAMNKPVKKKDIIPMAETLAIGVGVAHIVLGAIDLIEHRD